MLNPRDKMTLQLHSQSTYRHDVVDESSLPMQYPVWVDKHPYIIYIYTYINGPFKKKKNVENPSCTTIYAGNIPIGCLLQLMSY